MLLLNDNDVKKYILIFINRLGHCPLVICILNSLKRSRQSTKTRFAALVSMGRVFSCSLCRCLISMYTQRFEKDRRWSAPGYVAAGTRDYKSSPSQS